MTMNYIDDILILIIVAMFDAAKQRWSCSITGKPHKCMQKMRLRLWLSLTFSTANPLLLVKNIEKMKYLEENTRETNSFCNF